MPTTIALALETIIIAVPVDRMESTEGSPAGMEPNWPLRNERADEGEATRVYG